MLPWFTKYPNQNDEILNLDWVITHVENFKAAYEAFLAANSLTFADPIVWDITKQYSKNTIVLSPEGDAYLSKKVVGKGIQLNNTDYWLEIFNFAEYVRTANSNLTMHIEQNTTRATDDYSVDDWLLWDDVLYKVTAAITVDDLLTVGTNIIHFTVEDFCRAWQTYMINTIAQYKADIDASELAYKQLLDQTVLQYKNDIDASELAYKNQLDASVAATTESLQTQLNTAIAGVTVDSEVINARVGWDNTTYATLREAIVSQISDTIHFNQTSINAGNYSANLPDLNEATAGISYVLNFADGSTSIPAHYPLDKFEGGSQVTNILFSAKIYGWNVQILLTSKHVFFRQKVNTTWYDWEVRLSKSAIYPDSINATNFSTVLPDLNNAADNTSYYLNFANGSTSIPAHYPLSAFSGGNSASNYLMTFNTPYRKIQILYTENGIYFRICVTPSTWYNWALAGERNDNFYSSIITALNYSSYLPDLENVDSNVPYLLQFTDGSTSIPAHYPNGVFNGGVNGTNVFVQYDQGDRLIQFLTTYDCIWFRLYVKESSTWYAWNKIADAKDTRYLVCYQGQFYSKIQQAKREGYKKVLIMPGNYNLVSEITTATIESESFAGIDVSNLELIFLPGATLNYDYQGSNTHALNNVAPFYKCHGTIFRGMVLNAKNCRYAIHEENWELDTNNDYYDIEYHDCVITIDNTNNAVWDNDICIGAGLGANANILIENCIFSPTSATETGIVSYHPLATGNAFNGRLVIRNCYFDKKGTVKLIDVGTTAGKVKAFINNNSFGSSVEHVQDTSYGTPVPDQWTIYSYLNEVRI